METGLDIVRMDVGALNETIVASFDSFVKCSASFSFSKVDEYGVFHFVVDTKGKCEDNGTSIDSIGEFSLFID